MLRLIAGLSRSLPLLIALAVLALVIYGVISYVRTPVKAKEVLIKIFTVLCAVLSIFFALASLYSVADNNTPVLELALSCMAVGLIGLIVTRICAYFFKKHHPHYIEEPTVKAEYVTDKPDLLSTLTKILNYIDGMRKGR